MKKLPDEFTFTVVALLLSVILVHAAYVLHVRPAAEAQMAADRAAMKKDPDYVSQRSVYVVIKDYEQEAEIILMLWALAILGYKAVAQRREALPEDTRGLLVPRALLGALARFGATRNVQDASTVAHGICQSEADRLDSDLSMLRYIAWAIPAIGFIGTVRGIGDALSQAHKAVTGDISGVTEGLGVAFNSTLIALLLSILLMFLMQQLQQAQERRVLDTETWLDQRVIRNLQVVE